MQLSSVLRSIIFSVLLTNSLSNAVVTKRSNPKRGIAFAQNNGDDVHYLRGTQVSWSYNWYHSPTYLAPDVTGMPFIPMLWGPEGKVEFADRVISQGANIVLGFNEPDLEAQANMTAEGAAWVWQTYIDPLKYKGVRLGAPAVTSRPEGREWLRRFFSACTNCTIDFIPVHWFGPTLGEFYDYIWSIHYEYPQHKIWVTEVSPPQRSPTETTQFLYEAMAYMDNHLDWVERYSWFAWTRPDEKYGPNEFHLLNSDGTLNERGIMYLYS